MPTVGEGIESAKSTADFQSIAERLFERDWRLDHLYSVQDQHGNETLFVRNAAQRNLTAAEHLRNIIVKARQLGFSTLIEIELLDYCMFRTNTAAGIAVNVTSFTHNAAARIEQGVVAAGKALASARAALGELQEMLLTDAGSGDDLKLIATLRPEALKQTQEDGVKQNISTLSKRVNELGVAEPLIQQIGRAHV